MHLSEAYTLQDRKQKIINSNKVIDTQDDSDWDDLQTN